MTVNTFVGRSSLPAAYILMPGRKQEEYDRAFEALFGAGPLKDVSPNSVVTGEEELKNTNVAMTCITCAYRPCYRLRASFDRCSGEPLSGCGLSPLQLPPRQECLDACAKAWPHAGLRYPAGERASSQLHCPRVPANGGGCARIQGHRRCTR